jgi:hypothetical protein
MTLAWNWNTTSFTQAIVFFALKPIVKKLLIIEIVIFHTFALSMHNRQNIGHRMLPQTNLRKDLLRDYEAAFYSPMARTVLEKRIFKHFAVFTSFWPKYDLEMKVKVKSRTLILLHVLRQSFMQIMSSIITTTYTKSQTF